MHKLTRTLLAGCLTLGTLAIFLHAQAPAADPFVKDPNANANQEGPWANCLVVLEAYALDKSEAQSILESDHGSAARYRRVLELQKAGRARLETLTALTTKSGQRAVVESIDEVRYATEFDPPAIKNGLAAPTAWETRNAGDSLELEPVTDGRICDLNLVPQRVTLMGFKDMGGMTDDALVGQPLFNAQKITTSTTVMKSEVSYLGTMTPPMAQGIANGEAASEVWLTFLHTHLPSPTPAEMKPPAKGRGMPTIHLEYTCYSLDRAEAREILVGATTLNAPWEKMQALLSARKARLEHVMTINTKSGQRAVAEEIQEVRFATEYVPETRAASTEKTSRTTKSKPNAKPETDETTTTEEVTTTRTEANAERRPGYASSFEARNAGITVEVEPVMGPDGVSVDLTNVIQSVAYRGHLQATGVAARYPAPPLFETRKVTCAQTVLLGRTLLVGTLNAPGNTGVNERTDTGRAWLLFVRAHNEQ